jgi:hypothetical protein
MEINGLELPSTFVHAIREGSLRRRYGSWPLKREQDAYGNRLETELSNVYESEEQIKKKTAALTEHYKADGSYGGRSEWNSEPGVIPDITDFTKIICFGMSGDGADFCFDFREDADNPSVIWWADVYWRRVAPDFESFIALFNLSNKT